MSFGKLSHTMVFQPFNPQTTSTPNSDPTGLFGQYPGQPNFGYSLPPPMPLAPYGFQNSALMMNPMCPPQPQINPSQSGDQAQLANGARRKNATRETTATLKAWLYEHRKNPYPTKGEKIMLAIITRMSLNQVSTWFANARRRLKKENKMGGSTKDLDDSDSEDLTKSKKPSGNKVSGSTSSDNMNMDDLDDLDDINEDVSDVDDDENNSSFNNKDPKQLQNPTAIYPNFNLNKFPSLANYPQFPLFKPHTPLSQPSSSAEKREEQPAVKKPKIWSIADVATKPSPPTQKPVSPGRPLNVNLSSSSSSSSSCPSPMKNEQFLAAFSAVINQQSQPLSVPASSSPSSTTSTLSNISNESASFVNYQQLYYQHLTSQFTNEFLRHSFLQHQQQQQQQIISSQLAKQSEITNEQNVNTAKKDDHECEEQHGLKFTNKRELDDDESNSSFESNGSNGKKLKLSHESDLSSSSLSQSSPSSKRKLDDSI